MVAPAIIAALIGAGTSLMGKKQDAEAQKMNFLMQQMADSQKMFQSGLPSSPSGSSNNFLQRPLFGIGGQ